MPPLEDIIPRYTFSHFVVGPSNQLAHAAAVAAAGGGGRRYNPLFFVWRHRLGGKPIWCTRSLIAYAPSVPIPAFAICQRSASRISLSLRSNTSAWTSFGRAIGRQCDLLLVDDIQFLAGRVQTQEEFFHTFNAVHNADRQIVVTSDKYPQALERMEERLVSRFASGLVADIQSPELETRVAIIRNKAALEGIELTDEVAVHLAQLVRSNVRELEGTLIRLAAKFFPDQSTCGYRICPSGVIRHLCASERRPSAWRISNARYVSTSTFEPRI